MIRYYKIQKTNHHIFRENFTVPTRCDKNSDSLFSPALQMLHQLGIYQVQRSFKTFYFVLRIKNRAGEQIFF
jgi:hypothetical protein